MIRRSTWIVLIVFLALLAFLLYWQNRPDFVVEEPTASEPDPVPRESIFEIPEGLDVIAARVESSDSGLVVMEYDSDTGTWVLVDPPRDGADSQRIQGLIDQVVALRASNALETVPSLEVIGLENPLYEIQFSLSNEQIHTLYIGDATITGNNYYVRVDEGAPQIVGKFAIDNLVSVIDDLPILPTPMPEVEPTEIEE